MNWSELGFTTKEYGPAHQLVLACKFCNVHIGVPLQPRLPDFDRQDYIIALRFLLFNAFYLLEFDDNIEIGWRCTSYCGIP